MFLKKLKLTNFRNYSLFEQDFKELKTIIIGQNAQGKSNILEAINILSTSKSERANRDSDLILWGNGYSLIFADIEKKDELLQIALQINATGKRKLKVNGVLKRAPQADLIGNFFSVLFSSDDLYLIKGSPSLRRNFIDSILIQLDKVYNENFKNYQKAITQKNALLKRFYESGLSKKELKIQLEIWNTQIVEYGSEVILKRLSFLSDIAPVANIFLDNISKHSEDLKIVYESSILEKLSRKDLPTEKGEMKKLFQEGLEKVFEEELARSQAVIGPHRDDLLFSINDKDIKSFSSQGQQRSVVLALKLAELKIIEERINETPILLLDDVFAELDITRQDFLLHNLPENIQTFITTTHISDLQEELLKNAHVLEIKNGQVAITV